MTVLKELEYIRKKYDVPAYLGAKVLVPSINPWREGTIVGAESGFIFVSFSAGGNIFVYPPDYVDYIGDLHENA